MKARFPLGTPVFWSVLPNSAKRGVESINHLSFPYKKSFEVSVSIKLYQTECQIASFFFFERNELKELLNATFNDPIFECTLWGDSLL